MNFIYEAQVPKETFDAIVAGDGRVEVILHSEAGDLKLSAAVRIEKGAPKGFLDVSKE